MEIRLFIEIESQTWAHLGASSEGGGSGSDSKTNLMKQQSENKIKAREEKFKKKYE